MSPVRISTSSARPSSAVRAARIASPVPSGCSCTATSTPASANASCVEGEATTTIGSAPASRAAVSTQSTMRRPSTGWRCFGSVERMRVPSPAAITAAAIGVSVTESRARVSSWGSIEAPGNGGAGSAGGGAERWRMRWLGRQDSNLGSRDQNPLPYRLATPHCRPSIGAPPPHSDGTTRAGRSEHPARPADPPFPGHVSLAFRNAAAVDVRASARTVSFRRSARGSDGARRSDPFPPESGGTTRRSPPAAAGAPAAYHRPELDGRVR